MSTIMDTLQPFIIGGFSGCFATCVIQPVDMLKVRIQIKGEEISNMKAQGKVVTGSVSPLSVFKEILASGGIKSFYKGIDSALTRQVFYTTSRLGIYKTVFQRIKEKQGGKDLSFSQKAWCSAVAGFFGSIIGNPADLALIRMQNDTALPHDQRRNYKNVFDAFRRIVSEEGFISLWRGCTPTVVRAVVLNLGMLGPYDEIKERLNIYYGTKDTQQTRLMSSAGAGFLAAFMSLPFDNAKTKMQKMKQLPDGSFPYKNIQHCMVKTVSSEGFSGLWTGFPTYYMRIAPHVMMTLILQDNITQWMNSNKKKH